MGNQTVLYGYLCEKLSSGGLSKEEFDRIKDFPIGHNSLKDLVRLNVEIGNLDWRGDTLVNADRNLTIKLTEAEEKKLKETAESLGLTPRDFITQVIIQKLAE